MNKNRIRQLIDNTLQEGDVIPLKGKSSKSGSDNKPEGSGLVVKLPQLKKGTSPGSQYIAKKREVLSSVDRQAEQMADRHTRAAIEKYHDPNAPLGWISVGHLADRAGDLASEDESVPDEVYTQAQNKLDKVPDANQRVLKHITDLHGGIEPELKQHQGRTWARGNWKSDPANAVPVRMAIGDPPKVINKKPSHLSVVKENTITKTTHYKQIIDQVLNEVDLRAMGASRSGKRQLIAKTNKTAIKLANKSDSKRALFLNRFWKKH